MFHSNLNKISPMDSWTHIQKLRLAFLKSKFEFTSGVQSKMAAFWHDCVTCKRNESLASIQYHEWQQKEASSEEVHDIQERQQLRFQEWISNFKESRLRALFQNWWFLKDFHINFEMFILLCASSPYFSKHYLLTKAVESRFLSIIALALS